MATVDQARAGVLVDESGLITGYGPIMESRHDGLGNYLSVGGNPEEVVGRRAEALIGQSSAEFVAESDMTVVAEAFEEAWNQRKPVHLFIRNTAGDASWIHSRFELLRRDGQDEFLAFTRRIEAPDDGQPSYTLEA